ncbi:MAG: methyl-accepting chemotaxis sensory transducer [Nitrobacter vulgaris]|nr:methyl-accepting chemotaxis sensory transducer [Nitrobacter vulgaris]
MANEVKALANEAENATRDVTRQAGEIQTVIDHAIRQVTSSQRLVQEIDVGMTTESEAIGAQSSAVSEISTTLAAVSKSARGLRKRFKTLNAA